MSNISRTVLVTGATGTQGGAVARTLIRRGHRVRAFVRRENDTNALELAQEGAEIAPGNFNDRGTVRSALEGVDAVFAMDTPANGFEAEVRQMAGLAEMATTVGTPHLVYSSVAGAGDETGVSILETKRRIETEILTVGVPATVVAPVSFMENLLLEASLQAIERGRIEMPLHGRKGLQLIAVDDIADFVSHVIERRDPFLGRRIDIAGDEKSGFELAEILTRTLGRPIQYVPTNPSALPPGPMAELYQWLDKKGFAADIGDLRNRYPDVTWHDFESWAARQDWARLPLLAGRG